MIRVRAMVLRLLAIGALLIMSGRMVWIQVVKAGEIRERGEAIRLETKALKPVRGAIMDRAGRYLALSVASYTAVANTIQLSDAASQAEAAKALAPIIGLTQEAITAKLQQNPKTGWVPLAKGLDLRQAQAVQKLKMDGLYLEQQLTRTYPQGTSGNQLVGYVDAKGIGEYGLEAFYEEKLSGKAGEVTAEFTEGNTPIESTIQASQPSVPGLNLFLTVDMSLQHQVEQKLDEVVKKTKAKRALAMVMDVHSGELLVMAMRPGANPGDRTTWGDPLDFNRINNWAVQEAMSPGSIFKPITTAIALEERLITPQSTFVDSGRIVRSERVITNWDGVVPVHPIPLTVAQLLQNSSNVGLTLIGERIPHETFIKYLGGFGFMEKTGIDFGAEGSAVGLTGFDKKTDLDWANMYFGQHLMVTPLQMITAEAVIANGGKLVQPHLVREVRDPDGKVVWTAPTAPRRQVISENTAKEVQEMMVSVIEKGTATAAQVPGYRVGGKTGTAQKFENGVMKERMLADFVGFAPASNPQLIMLVMIDEPEGQGYGGVLAAPVFAELMPTVMRSIGIMPDSPAARGEEKAPPKVTTGIVPNVVWLPAKWAQERLTEAGYQVKLKGTGGLVSAQSLKAGSFAKVGSAVELTLAPPGGTDDPVHVPDFTGLSLAEAGSLAVDVGLTLKAGGSGFVAAQAPVPGTVVPARSILSVRLAPPQQR